MERIKQVTQEAYELAQEDDNEPHWLTCQTIAEAHGCSWWTLEEVTNE